MMRKWRSPRSAVTVGAVTAAVLSGYVLAAAPASAAPAQPFGTVVSPAGINERQYPSTDSKDVGSLAHRAQVGLKCKVRAQNIDGNTVWYLLRARNSWVAARYVANTGAVPYCKDV